MLLKKGCCHYNFIALMLYLQSIVILYYQRIAHNKFTYQKKKTKRIAHNKFISVSMACILCKMAYGRFWSFFPSLYRIIGVMHKLLIFLYCRHGCYVSLSFLKNICICFLLIPGMAYMIAWVSGAWDLLDVFEHFSKSFRLMLQVWEVSCLLWWWRRREES